MKTAMLPMRCYECPICQTVVYSPTPITLWRYDDERGRYVELQQPVGGMSLRDYFAGQALYVIGFGLARQMPDASQQTIVQVVAEGAYQLADAMITEREK